MVVRCVYFDLLGLTMPRSLDGPSPRLDSHLRMDHTRRDFVLSAAGAGAAIAGASGVAACTPPPAQPDNLHVVLLGDSIFDNGRYVPGKPSVIDQLATELGGRGRATLLAVDGDVTRDVGAQRERLPADATHLVVSVGGNDALPHTRLLDKPLNNASELLVALAQAQDGFRADYRRMLDGVRSHGKPVAVCTIYDSNFAGMQKRLADVALAVWNDVILREAGAAGVPVIDLRRIFTVRADYSNPIEPSEVGGAKMVKAIAAVVSGHDFTSGRTTLYC